MDLMQGFMSLLNTETILWIMLGVTVGTLVGAIPGIGPASGMAILLPMSFTLSPINGLLFLMGIYQGAMYGGRISSILINVPGDADAVATTFDGYPMTKKGKAGYALTLSAIASFIGGIFGFLGLAFFTPYVARAAYIFGPAEYFALVLFALIVTSGIGSKHKIKGLIALCFGLLIATVGRDSIEGAPRLTFGMTNLWDGIPFVVVMIGVFGLSELLILIEQKREKRDGLTSKIRFKDLFPRYKDVAKNTGSISRGSLIGFLIGVLPGAGATVATFLSYNIEKKISKTPEKFGTGIDQGLTSPESANNASVGGALIPLFSFGIPGSGTAAILLGALIMFGLQPGPLMFERSGDIIWASIAGLFIANILLLILNTLFVPIFTLLIKKAEPYLIPMVATLCFAGTYMLNNSFFDVGLMILFGVIGYLLRKFEFPLAPFILPIILGQMLETSFRQALLQSRNDVSIFLTRPISLVLLILCVAVLLWPAFTKLYRYVSGKSENSQKAA